MSILETKDIKDNQKVLMDILLAFDKTCAENNIEYFLAGGTMLGAVRHGGFLPWDDDIDLYMRTSEWEAKKEILREKLPSKYVIISEDKDELYCNPVIRIADTETTQIARSRLSDRTAHGVQIDIFLLDPLPTDEEDYKKYIEDFWVYCELKTPTMQMANPSVPVNESIETSYYNALERVKEEGRQAVIEEMEERLFSYKEEDCQNFHLRWGGYWVEVPIDAFKEAVRVPFEDSMLPIPSGYPYVLFGEYGDTWMMIPDNSGVWTHDTVESFTIPYTRYDEEIAKAIDLDEYREVQKKNKEYKVKRQFLDNKLRKNYVLHKAAIAKGILRNTEDIDKYIEIQKALFKDQYLIPVDDDTLCQSLVKQIVVGDLDYARGIAKYYTGDNDKILEILEDVESIRNIRYSYYLGSGESNIDDAVSLAQKYVGQINLIEFVCQIQTQQGQIDDDLENLIKQAIKEHGERPRLIKIAADIEMTHGRVEHAKEKYESILETSRDGMVNMEIKDILRKEFL